MTKPPAWRISVTLGGGGVLALFVFLFREQPDSYVATLNWWSLGPYPLPFIDTRFILSAIDCQRLGLNPFIVDPCDPYGRPYDYSPLLLEAARLGLTSRATDWIGIGLGLVMIGSVASLPAPRGFRDGVFMALAALSTTTVLAVERGNIDVLIFALAIAAGYLIVRGPAARWAAYLVVVLAACLKFYPVVLLLLALREKPRRLIAVCAAAAVLIALFLATYGSELAEAWSATPPRLTSQQLWGFGAINLPRGMQSMLAPILASDPALAWIPAKLLWLFLIVLYLSSFRQALTEARPENRAGLANLSGPEAPLLVAGAVLIVSCFYAGENPEYRGIFFLLTFPGLLTLMRAEGGTRYRFTTVAMIALMWRYSLVHLVDVGVLALPDTPQVLIRAAVWFAFELLWWRVAGTLLGLLFAFATESPIGMTLLKRLARGVHDPESRVIPFRSTAD